VTEQLAQHTLGIEQCTALHPTGVLQSSSALFFINTVLKQKCLVE
jgi:hypothetical protein